jgi:hypothetical protein
MWSRRIKQQGPVQRCRMTRRELRVLLAILFAIAVGVNWTAWESHIANLGVKAMATALSGERTRKSL